MKKYRGDVQGMHREQKVQGESCSVELINHVGIRSGEGAIGQETKMPHLKVLVLSQAIAP